MPMTQTQRGLAFEYAVANKLAAVLGAPLDRQSSAVSKECYEKCSLDDSQAMDAAALSAAGFLHDHDAHLSNAQSIRLNTQAAGKIGDVRDVLIHTGIDSVIGVSAKTRHHAIKHSRLSKTIDFGREWAGHPVSNSYWNAVHPIFAELSELRDAGALFRDIKNKAATVYLPILTAFEDEFARLCQALGSSFIRRVFRYLIGVHDFYKVIQEDESVFVQPFNMNGTLGWGKRWTIPEGVEQIRRKPKSKSTLLVSFAGGWQISFRLHSAKKEVEPSLKFDINFEGMPPYATGSVIPTTTLR